MDKQDILQQAKTLIQAEADALSALADQLDDSFVALVEAVATCSGHIFMTGAGTSASMARRTAHLLATCGLPAFFLNAGDALHGESALFSEGDVFIGLSKSGKSAEVIQLAEIGRQRGVTVIAWTANLNSVLAQQSDIVIKIDVDPSAEGDGILPFGSTLANGAVGDALTLVAMRIRGFDLKTMRQTHPAGGVNDLIK